MKLFAVLSIFAVLAVCFICSTNAQPLEDVATKDLVAEANNAAEIEGDTVNVVHTGLRRSKRATCDLLSAWNVQHTACATHCIVFRGKKGGYCNSKAVCVCR